MNESDLLREAMQLSRWGEYERSWEWAIKRIPNELWPRLLAKDIAALVDAFMMCYADGWARK